MTPPMFKKSELMSQIIMQNGKRKWVWKYGVNAVPKLMKIYYNLNPLRTLAKWPKTYQNFLSQDSQSWKHLLYSLITTDEDKNVTTTNNATEIFNSLATVPVGTRDLWVLLCENISKIIEDELQYQEIMKIILLTALHEKDGIHDRIADMTSMLSNNPWFLMCRNIIPFIEDEYQKCYTILLFLALSGQQKVYLLNYLTGNKEEMAQNNSIENIFSLLFMTEERWVNLIEVVELLKRKREILRMLSIDASQKFVDVSKENEVTTETEIINKIKEDQGLEDAGPSISNHKEIEWELNNIHGQERARNAAYNTIQSENIKFNKNDDTKNTTAIRTEYVKQELDSKVKDEVIKVKKEEADTTNTVAISIKTEQLDIIQKPDSEIIKSEVNERGNTTFSDFSNSANITVKEEVSIETNQSINTISQPNKTIAELCDNDPLLINKKADIEKHKLELSSLDKLIFGCSFQKIYKRDSSIVITEGCIDISEDDDVKVKVEEKDLKSLDKLILDYSIQQVNKNSSTITIDEDCINISEDDDNEDCVVQEDSKLEVAQLLNMYHEIVLDKPTEKPRKMLLNPLAGQNNKQTEAKDSGINNLASQSGNSLQHPSTSSTIKSNSKINIPMRSQKVQMKMKKKKNKRDANIKKLFLRLSNQSLNEPSNESQTSVPPADNNNDTVIVLDDTLTPKKRKFTAIGEEHKGKRMRYFGRVVADDDDAIALIPLPNDNQEVTSETPTKVLCSTPIIKRNNIPDFIPIKEILKKPENTTNTVENKEITDLTKDYNPHSYYTIDLTAESLNCSSVSKTQNTVIDLDKIDKDNAECSVVSISNSNLSLSGESDVTVLNVSRTKKERQMRKFAKGIARLDAAEKGRLLELITQNIFSGCNVVDKKKKQDNNIIDDREQTTKATDTLEDTYIKDVILGQAPSRNSIGSNIYNPEKDIRHKTGLRMIVIDGSNVAVEHGRGTFFSVMGLKICIDYFLKRGHVVKAFVPRYRCKAGKSSNPRLLDELERRGLVVYTPSREVQGRMITPYDDRYIVQCAAEFDGIIVSGDNYRDLLHENPRWRAVIENRVLPFTWVNDMIMFPRDPLGRNGPPLEMFLTHPGPQPNNQR